MEGTKRKKIERERQKMMVFPLFFWYTEYHCESMKKQNETGVSSLSADGGEFL